MGVREEFHTQCVLCLFIYILLRYLCMFFWGRLSVPPLGPFPSPCVCAAADDDDDDEDEGGGEFLETSR